MASTAWILLATLVTVSLVVFMYKKMRKDDDNR